MTKGTHRIPEESFIYCCLQKQFQQQQFVWHRCGIKLEPVTTKPTPIRRRLGQRLQFVFLAELPRLSSCSGHKYSLSINSTTMFLQPLKCKSSKSPMFQIKKSSLCYFVESTVLKGLQSTDPTKKNSLSPIFHCPL